RGVQDARVRTRSYLRRVASPPRRCRSALFFSSTCLTRRAISRLMRGSRSVRSLWTVLLLTPKTTAAWRTVAWELRMYVPRSTTRLRMYSFIAGPPRPDLLPSIWAPGGEYVWEARLATGPGRFPWAMGPGTGATGGPGNRGTMPAGAPGRPPRSGGPQGPADPAALGGRPSRRSAAVSGSRGPSGKGGAGGRR